MSKYSDLIVGTTGLVSYWRLGETSGSAADSFGTNTGTYVNTPTLGAAGGIVDDPDTAVTVAAASSQMVTVAAINQSPGPISWELWLTRSDTSASNMGLMGKASLSILDLNVIVAGQLRWRHAVGGTGCHSSVNITDTTTWHHIVATVSGTTWTLYIDGVDVTVTETAASFSDSSATLEIGHNPDGGAAWYFSGSIDEIAIYNVALTAAQIYQHYTVGITANYAYRPVDIANQNVGPRALRRQFRKRFRRMWGESGLAGPQTYNVTMTESVQSGDGWARIGTLLRAESESTTSADAWSRIATLPRALTESVQSADVWTRIQTAVRTFTDSVQSADVLTRVGTFLRTETEAVTSADAWTRVGTFARTLTETVTHGDVWTGARLIVRALTEAVTSSDAWTRTATFLRTTTESVQSADVWARLATMPRTLTEAVQSADVWTRAGTFRRTFTEGVTQADSWFGLKIIARTMAEAVTSSDAWTRAATVSRSLTSSVQSSDVWTRTSTYLRATAESVTSSDAWTRAATLVRSFTSAVSQIETWASQMAGLASGIPPTIASVVSAVTSAIASRLGPPDGGASNPKPGR